MFLKLTTVCALMAVAATPALAQYTGPAARKAPVSVSEVLKSGIDDQDVRLQGRIVRQVGNEKYIFADATGEIRVEIDDALFVSALDDKATVIITGEIEKDFMESPEIDVETLRRP
ncbi:MAG: NirD/YgiW/YdeI family stress tolerance protein [Asticcacaulis sp.]